MVLGPCNNECTMPAENVNIKLPNGVNPQLRSANGKTYADVCVLIKDRAADKNALGRLKDFIDAKGYEPVGGPQETKRGKNFYWTVEVRPKSPKASPINGPADQVVLSNRDPHRAAVPAATNDKIYRPSNGKTAPNTSWFDRIIGPPMDAYEKFLNWFGPLS